MLVRSSETVMVVIETVRSSLCRTERQFECRNAHNKFCTPLLLCSLFQRERFETAVAYEPDKPPLAQLETRNKLRGAKEA